jgi:hypothetical protein
MMAAMGAIGPGGRMGRVAKEMTEVLPIAEVRRLVEQEAARRGYKLPVHSQRSSPWDVAASDSSYTSLERDGMRWDARIADHDAGIGRMLTYGMNVVGARSPDDIAKAFDKLDRSYAAGIAKRSERAAQEQAIAERGALVNALLAERGQSHLTGEARKAARKVIIDELKGRTK